MQLNKPASFRPPNSKFVMMFNAAMDATGVSINDLCVAALAVGLPKVVPQLIQQRQKQEEARKRAEAQFQRYMDPADALSLPNAEEAAEMAAEAAAQEVKAPRRRSRRSRSEPSD